jgi:hypothetical protein
LGGIVVADMEYPPRVAFALLNKLLATYAKDNAGWKTSAGDIEYAPLKTMLVEYQDPSKADKISAIQRELDETTAVLVSLYLLNVAVNMTTMIRAKPLTMSSNEARNSTI